ncbi:MAG TPA: flagellar basal-body MS-ring/collar protein FliF [Phenylobacterium sp.]|nr:flagellar basal-body MS-ring/collar protein FliF [Phenylobacterium sp.]
MNPITSAIQRFGIGRLAAFVGIGIGVIAALAAVFMNLGQQPKALLYSNLDMKEAASITQALDQAGVKYEAKGDGTTIMVPRDEVASTRLMLSGKGLPTSGSVGYELFDNASALGQTDFVQQLNRQRALEGELARTIRSLDGVTFARVHLVLPKRQLFEEEAEAPSGSVTIGVGGREPNPEQVRAVQNLVAGAVPNLKPDRVTVVDQHAKTLSAANDGEIAGAAADSRRSEVEQRMAQRIRQLVEGVVGPGKARVNVSAELEMAQVTTSEERFDPDGQVVRSEQTNEESGSESQADDSGQVSAGQNIPGSAPTLGQIPLTSSNNRTNQSTTNYEISKTVRTETTAPGDIKRLSVAVAVDGVTAVGAGGKPGAYTPRSAEEMQRIEQLVRAAMGFSADRSDQVSVVNVRFPTTEAGGEAGTESASPLMGFDKNDIMRAAEIGVLAIVAVLMMLFVVRPLLKGGGAPGGDIAVTHLQTSPVGGPPGQLAYDPATGQPLLAGPTNDVEQRIDIARIEGQVKASSVKRVAEFVEGHPEESVSILRSWLHEST